MAGANGKRLTGIILFILAIVGVAAFIFLLYADAEGLENVPGVGDVANLAILVAILLGIMALVIIILLLVRLYDRREHEAAEAEAFFIPEDNEDDLLDFAEVTDEVEEISEADDGDDAVLTLEKVVPHDLAGVPLGSHAWGTTAVSGNSRVHSFHYPLNEPSGLYNNDYITINSAGDQVKLRTLLAAPPHAFDGRSDEPVRGATGAAKSELEKRLAERPKKAAKKAVEKAVAKEAAPAKKAPAKKAAAKKPAYYDYGGDVHDVIDVEGIGPVYAKRLSAIGVKTTARLCYEDAASLARSIQANEGSVRSWQLMAELMRVNGIGPQYAEALVRAGVDGIADVKKRSAEAIAKQVNEYLESLEVNVLGQKITPRRVEGWKKAVKPMRKTRRAVPEE